MAAADVGDLPTRFQFFFAALERWNPGRNQMRRVAGTKKALGADE